MIPVSDQLTPRNGQQYAILNSRHLIGGAVSFDSLAQWQAHNKNKAKPGQLVALPGAWYMVANDRENLLLVCYLSNNSIVFANGSTGAPFKYVGNFVPGNQYFRNNIVTQPVDGIVTLFILTGDEYSSPNNPNDSNQWVSWGPAAINTGGGADTTDWTALNDEVSRQRGLLAAIVIS